MGYLSSQTLFGMTRTISLIMNHMTTTLLLPLTVLICDSDLSGYKKEDKAGQKLSLQYAIRVKADKRNPTHNTLFRGNARNPFKGNKQVTPPFSRCA